MTTVLDDSWCANVSDGAARHLQLPLWSSCLRAQGPGVTSWQWHKRGVGAHTSEILQAIRCPMSLWGVCSVFSGFSVAARATGGGGQEPDLWRARKTLGAVHVTKRGRELRVKRVTIRERKL